MTHRNDEKRKYKRHGREGNLEYKFSYDMETKVEFQIEDNNYVRDASPKFLAYSKNLSAEGMCFVSNKKLEKGTPLHLSIYLPECDEKVDMEGEVKWSECVEEKKEQRNKDHKKMFDTGIKLSEVNGRPVLESIHYDELFHLQWSVALESIFGRYRLIMDDKKKESK